MSGGAAGGWRRWVAAGLLVLLVGGYAAWRVAGFVGAGPPPRDCRARITVIAADGTRWPGSTWRCRRPAGPAPALLVWGGSPEATEAWIARFQDGWPWSGREAWTLDSVPPGDRAAVRGAVNAALEAMGAEWSVDPGRIGVLLQGPACRAWPVPGAAAVVLVDPPAGLDLPDPPPADLLVVQTGPLGWTGRAARRADGFFRSRLLPPGAGGRAREAVPAERDQNLNDTPARNPEVSWVIPFRPPETPIASYSTRDRR